MYKDTMIFLISYIKSIAGLEALEIFDAQKTFIEPDNYASIFILDMPLISKHDNLISTGENVQNNTKEFRYKQSNYIELRVDFRGSDCHSNLALFNTSFLKDTQREMLKEAGFGFLGLGSQNQIPSLRDIKSRAGVSQTLKLITSNLVVDESQIIDTFDVDVSIIT